jgi:hypothetical protein
LSNRDDPLLRSLVPDWRLEQSPDRDAGGAATLFDAEARTITPGGVVAGFGARKIAPVESLHRRKLVTDRHYRAATRIYAAWAFGVHGVRVASKGCSAWAPAGVTDSQLAALADFRKVRGAVPVRLWWVIPLVVLQECSVSEVASRAGRHPSVVMEVLRLGLDYAADSFGW